MDVIYVRKIMKYLIGKFIFKKGFEGLLKERWKNGYLYVLS